MAAQTEVTFWLTPTSTRSMHRRLISVLTFFPHVWAIKLFTVVYVSPLKVHFAKLSTKAFLLMAGKFLHFVSPYAFLQAIYFVSAVKLYALAFDKKMDAKKKNNTLIAARIHPPG